MLLGAALERRFAGAGTAGALAAWVLLFLFWAPLLHLSEILLDFPIGGIFALVSALLVLPVLIELKPLAARVSHRAVPAALGAIALAAWIAVALAPAYSADRKQGFRIEYGWDQKTQRGRWLLADDGAPLPANFPGAGAFRKGAEVPWSASKRRAAPAPSIALAPPQLEKIAERAAAGGGRLITLRIASKGSDQVVLRGEPDAGLSAVRIAGSPARFGAGKKTDPFFIRCAGRSCDGATIELLTTGSAPLTLTLIGVRFGLPAAGAPLAAARPATAQPQYSPDSSFAVDRLPL
jgi:hypothetical protein